MKTNEQTINLHRTIGKLETHILNLNESLADFKATVNRLQKRVEDVERHHSFLRGGIGVVLSTGTLLGFVFSLATKWLIGR